MPLNVLDLFSGIGGFSLGLERAGMRTVAFCEIDPYCRAVLRKHWPDVPCHGDVRAFDGVPCDVICGGFPCQDISSAGKRAGIDGERSGLWGEYARLIRQLRPSYVIVENVADLASRGLDRVLGDLAEIGYDAEWDCVPAAAVGAPQLRERVFIVAYPHDPRRSGLEERNILPQAWESPSRRKDAYGLDLADAGPWSRLPGVLRVDYGIPEVMDRLECVGNAVVPEIPYQIGRRILEVESSWVR